MPLSESKTFLELPSRCLFVAHWLELHYLTTPYNGDRKVCFLTGNGHPKQNWGLVSKERGKHDIGEAASCFCHNQQEIHYISRSPEAEQAAGSIQRWRQRPRNFPSLHSTTHSIGSSLRPALLHFVGWLPTIKLHASLFKSSRRVRPLKSKEARGHF